MGVLGKQRRVRRSRPQKRGLERREKLCAAAMALLEDHEFGDITYQQIADQAGMPLASCYNFYRSKKELVRQLANDLTQQYLRVVLAEERFLGIESWWQGIERHVALTVAHHNGNAAELRIFFSGEVPQSVRQDSLERERVISERLLEVLGQHFDLSPYPKLGEKAFYAIEIGRAVLAIDYQVRGRIDGASVEEASRAMIGYMSNYLPKVLPRR